MAGRLITKEGLNFPSLPLYHVLYDLNIVPSSFPGCLPVSVFPALKILYFFSKGNNSKPNYVRVGAISLL